MRLIALLAISLSLLLLGCNGGNGGDNSPPSVSASFSRTELPFSGGSVQITVTVSDPSGVELAQIDLSPRPSDFNPINLNPQNQKSITSTVTISLPLNSSSADAVYQVILRVRDALGNEGSITVGTLVVKSPLGVLPDLPNPSGAFSD